jgi:hypothetical protein
MAVRKIPKNHLVVTGRFASQKNGQMDEFESLLEKEFMLLLDFDECVAGFECQPVNIPIPGVPKGYTPDFLVRYHPDCKTGHFPKPLLTEVKHTDDLERNREKYVTKFALAEQYAQEQGWEFCITTQLDIRIPRLANLKFLREYRNITPDENDFRDVLEAAGSGTVTISDLLNQLAPDDDSRLHWLPIIWNAVLTRRLVADWEIPIDYTTTVQIAGGLR